MQGASVRGGAWKGMTPLASGCCSFSSCSTCAPGRRGGVSARHMQPTRWSPASSPASTHIQQAMLRSTQHPTAAPTSFLRFSNCCCSSASCSSCAFEVLAQQLQLLRVQGPLARHKRAGRRAAARGPAVAAQRWRRRGSGAGRRGRARRRAAAAPAPPGSSRPWSRRCVCGSGTPAAARSRRQPRRGSAAHPVRMPGCGPARVVCRQGEGG